MISAHARFMRRAAMLLASLSLGGCGPHRSPPPTSAFEGLPVSGSLADAHRAGFTNCIDEPAAMRCRREGVMLAGQGPYQAAVDLVGSDGSGGFDQLVLWHDDDQFAVHAVGEALERKGWQSCLTGRDAVGDQEIYTRRGVPFIVSIDLSYWGKRRLRVIPSWARQKPTC